MIRFHCPECGELEQAGRDDRGKAFNCRRCGKRLVVPPKNGKALPGVEPPPVVVLKVLKSPTAPIQMPVSFEPKAAPAIAGLAIMALFLCWTLAALKLYKLETLPYDTRTAFEQYSFPQRMGWEQMTPPSRLFDKCILLNLGLSLGMVVTLVLVAIAAPRVGARRPGLGLFLLVAAMPLPLFAFL